MRITVFGASGKVGRLVVAGALARGWRVTAFVHRHNPFAELAAAEAERLVVVQGEISDRAAVERALAGSAAVISALGSWGTKDKDILTRGMGTIIPAMEARGLARLVTLTGAGARWSGDDPGFLDKCGHALLGLAAPKILRDGEAHLRLLEASRLDWSCLRSPIMKASAETRYQLDTRPPALLATIPRAAVAQALLDQLEDGTYRQQAPFIHRATPHAKRS